MIFSYFEAFTLVISLVAIYVSIRAYILTKRTMDIQSDMLRLSQKELESKQEPRLQIINETFLSTWQRLNNLEKCSPDQLDIVYSAKLINKSDSPAYIETIQIEIGITDTPLGTPTNLFSIIIKELEYIKAGEEFVLDKTVTPDAMKTARMFAGKPNGILVFNIVFRYAGYSNFIHSKRSEIYRINVDGGVISNLYRYGDCPPRSYPLNRLPTVV